MIAFFRILHSGYIMAALNDSSGGVDTRTTQSHNDTIIDSVMT